MWHGRAAAIQLQEPNNFSLFLCVFFWDFDHPAAGIWPGTSLSVMAPVAGQARVVLFEYTPGSVPSAAGATGRGWVC